MKKNWILLTSPIPDKVSKIAQELGISKITAEILVAKGYTIPEEAYKFLNPKIEDLHDPFLLPQMELASTRIIQAINSHQKILIYGDYDVDGTTASALFYNALKKLNITPEIYIPNRTKEGYGLTKKGLEYCLKSYVNLIITVDCGTAGVEEIELLQSKGIDVIVTDHHEPHTKLPEAFAIINPKVNQRKEGNELSGCGIAFKLAQAVYKNLGIENKELLNYLDLVALATVCDVTPLIGENRILTKYGMKVIENTENTGLKALLEISELEDVSINPYHLGFILGPKINAQGRLGEAKEVVKFLTTENRGEADKIAQKLEEENKKRQTIQGKIFEEAVEEIEKFDLSKKNGIIIAKEGWHPGVIGIVASKIQEKFFRPTLLIAIDGEIGKGSARSIPTFHLYNALSQCKDYLLTFGGHRLAAGFVIQLNNIPLFKEKFENILAQLNYEDLIPKFIINREISLKEIDEKLVQEIERFAPFGLGNPRPIFLTRNAQVVGTPEVMKKKHIKFRVRAEGNRAIKTIGFELGEIFLSTGQYINLIYEIEREKQLGEAEVLLRVKDIELNT